ncbi:MAG: hypothetical protein LBU32_09065 [Clostridiales bacterium]|nr:hypothetical protein [Clostridiales bacterium]
MQGNRLTDDFSLFGQICFSKGKVQVYDIFGNNYTEVDVDRGTIIIDAYTYWERNLGCVNNTIAHEAFHWHRHRLFAAIRSLLRGEKLIACRCPINTPNDEKNAVWTDERSMEWQADKISPRILMPIETFKVKIEELYEKYSHSAHSALRTEILECVIDELAAFYNVSKQSAKIRMIDLGYKVAAGVYNYEDSYAPYFSNISPRDAFYEYSDNEEFRKVVDSGLFVYADGYFTTNDEKYVTENADGAYSLTTYAWDNLAECTLQFTYRRVNMQEHGRFHSDAFHRANRNAYEKLPRYDADRNISVVGNAEELQKKREEFEAQYTQHKALTKTFWQRAYEIMEMKHWNSSVFCERTQLNEITYSRAKNNNESLPDVRTVIAMCAGLDLDMPLTTELLSLAGHTLSNSREHQALGFVITGFKGKGIYERNAFLESLDLQPLGSKQRL